jgi:Ca2+-binding RTX toxin-like protein
LKGGQGDDVISGGKGHDRLYGNSGQNIFLDERDGSKDRIYIVQDEKQPDRIMGLDAKDRIVIEPLSGLSSIGLMVEKVELANVGQALLISIGNNAVAYYTGDDLTKRELLLMASIG